MSNCFIGRTVFRGFNDFQLMRRFLFWSLCFCLLFPVGLSSCDGSDSAAVIFGNDREAYMDFDGGWCPDDYRGGTYARL